MKQFEAPQEQPHRSREGHSVPVAVTGAAGRVGSAVVDMLLSRGYSVVAIDRATSESQPSHEGMDIVAADLTDYRAICHALEGCGALIHLAAIPGPRRESDVEVHNNNVVASYNAMRAAIEVGIERICQASSINAIGAAFSRAPRYDYLPVDEAHPTYNEDPYSLSKWVSEQQAASLSRRFETVSITSLRLHLVAADEVEARAFTTRNEAMAARHLWGWTASSAAAEACLLALDRALPGDHVYNIVAPRQVGPAPTGELLIRYYPDVSVRRALAGDDGLIDCAAAERELGWRHDAYVSVETNRKEDECQQ